MVKHIDDLIDSARVGNLEAVQSLLRHPQIDVTALVLGM